MALYHKIILQHFKQPSNRGKLSQPTEKFTGVNYFCGDKLTIYVKLDQQGRVEKVAWEGEGCAISQAAASLFSEIIKGKKLSVVKKMSSKVLLDAIDADLSPTRMKCALLPLYTIKQEEIDLDYGKL